MSSTEYVVLVDEKDQEIGLSEKIKAHQKNLLHRAFSVFLFQGEPGKSALLLQQRAFHKYHSQGLWTNACCSHPRKGEDIIEAGMRRLQEELGITTTLVDVGWFQYTAHFQNGLSENEVDHVLVGTLTPDIILKPNPHEVHATRWITIDSLQQALTTHRDQYTPWLKQALEIIMTSTFTS
ncbi:MAG: isopentenyl-diphosphate delta-isomerase [Gammaproteobacteria bacterium RIFCSPHIGHO2_12_FULL_42_10]|nr:MAG: isopentenyl-diphosphate delta-isomerase [Gammaproteobacteria bacterium RIFCSPHIGHO2_12_FULL_42_10]